MNRRSRNGYKVRAFDLDVKSVDDAGHFSGYGSVFGNVDSYGEIVAPGAFGKSLKELQSSGRALPILWQHDTYTPIGSWSGLKEDDHGLFGDGELWINDAPNAKIAYRGMKSKAITGLSIGYYVLDSSYNEKTGVRTLNELDLVEISIVTNPANPDARIEAVKSVIAHGGMPSLSQFERFLRDAGFSKSQSAVIANRGLKHLLQSESGSEANDVGNRLLDSLKSLSF
ncbi:MULTISPECIES: HK97 family phage prohead protease [unclassified Caballeronia]|uniref:HK97 family phage prohead protease n=1 Tax=unclassified Caballeronia TaxID=2646786 RepID=UPI00285DF172|nr:MULTISPECIES: HK97 family phage prohead protease [unclassified Caballeronia]MDR5777297.1 HK97 family phage prohead protease [Caballeronia sp. LZ002]MDR5802569.1 HK97 family phage prohead protease [Caballeronia sp. LZ001]MDR5852735.1 HK97 family phage prohead protease [Caballeronia sp. LZ003]